MTHTPGPWYQLSGVTKTERIISNTVGPHWAGEDHYVGQVTANNAALVALAPVLLEFVRDMATMVLEGDADFEESDENLYADHDTYYDMVGVARGLMAKLDPTFKVASADDESEDN